MFTAPEIQCPSCNGGINSKPFSLAALFGGMVIGDIAIYALAGIFLLIGFKWEPALVIAVVIVIFGAVRRSSAQTYYVCAQCRHEFTYKELYARTPSNKTVEADARKNDARGSP